MPKGKSQPGEAPTHQIWNNFSIKINNDSSGLKHIEKDRKPSVYIDINK